MEERLAGLATEVERRAERYVGHLQELVRVSAEGEDATQGWVASALRALGCEVDAFPYSPRDLAISHQFVHQAAVAPRERTCVVGGVGARDHAARLLLFAHPDVEPGAGTAGWRHPPFAGAIEGGRLYGWGAADDLLGVATMVSALDAVAGAGLTLGGGLLLASTPSKGYAQGIVAVLNRGYRVDGALYLHPAESGNGLEEIKAVTPGLLRFRITVAGRPPATREPEQTPFHHQAVNPIDKAWAVAMALGTLAERRAGRVRHPALDAAVGRATNLQLAYVHAGDPAHLGRVSDACVLAGSVTFPPGERLEEVQAEVAAAVEAASTADAWLRDHPPVIEWLFGVRGAEVAPDDLLYRALSGAITAVTGREPRVNALHASSDIGNPILHAGIPTLGFGPRAGDLSQAGGHDEWVDLEEYVQTVAVTARLIAEWCGTAREA